MVSTGVVDVVVIGPSAPFNLPGEQAQQRADQRDDDRDRGDRGHHRDQYPPVALLGVSHDACKVPAASAAARRTPAFTPDAPPLRAGLSQGVCAEHRQGHPDQRETGPPGRRHGS